PIAAIICNHSRRVLLVTLRPTVHLPLEVRCNMSGGNSRARVRLRQDQAFAFKLNLVLTAGEPCASSRGAHAGTATPGFVPRYSGSGSGARGASMGSMDPLRRVPRARKLVQEPELQP